MGVEWGPSHHHPLLPLPPRLLQKADDIAKALKPRDEVQTLLFKAIMDKITSE